MYSVILAPTIVKHLLKLIVYTWLKNLSQKLCHGQMLHSSWSRYEFFSGCLNSRQHNGFDCCIPNQLISCYRESLCMSSRPQQLFVCLSLWSDYIAVFRCWKTELMITTADGRRRVHYYFLSKANCLSYYMLSYLPALRCSWCLFIFGYAVLQVCNWHLTKSVASSAVGVMSAAWEQIT